MQPHKVATWSDVPDREPVGALVSNVDLVIVRFDGNHSVLYGRCLHRGALMCDGRIAGDNIICGLHGWDYVFHTGVSSYDNSERLAKFVISAKGEFGAGAGGFNSCNAGDFGRAEITSEMWVTAWPTGSWVGFWISRDIDNF